MCTPLFRFQGPSTNFLSTIKTSYPFRQPENNTHCLLVSWRHSHIYSGGVLQLVAVTKQVALINLPSIDVLPLDTHEFLSVFCFFVV